MRLADPITARTGTFLKSFDIGEYKNMLVYCEQTEKAMKRNNIPGEIVFTKILAKKGKNDTWQVFLLQK